MRWLSGNSPRPGLHDRHLYRLLGCGNTRCGRRDFGHLRAGIRIRRLERAADSNAPALSSGGGNTRWSRSRVFGSDGRSRLATRKGSNRGLAYIDDSDCKCRLALAVPSKFSMANRRCGIGWVDGERALTQALAFRRALMCRHQAEISRNIFRRLRASHSSRLS